MPQLFFPVSLLSHNYIPFCRRAVGWLTGHLSWLGSTAGTVLGPLQHSNVITTAQSVLLTVGLPKKPASRLARSRKHGPCSTCNPFIQQMSQEGAAITEMKGGCRRGKSRNTTYTFCWELWACSMPLLFLKDGCYSAKCLPLSVLGYVLLKCLPRAEVIPCKIETILQC